MWGRHHFNIFPLFWSGRGNYVLFPVFWHVDGKTTLFPPVAWWHRNSKAIGIILEGSKRIGYTSDTEYFDGMRESYEGCDYLILNCLRPRDDPWPEHMNAAMAERLISEVRPKLAVLTHLGLKLIGKADSEARLITKNTGIKTIAAKDNMILEL